MRAYRLSFGVLLAALLAGCMQNAAVSDTDRSLATNPTPLGAETFAGSPLGPAVGPDLAATTAAAPKLVPGEWWKIRYTSEGTDRPDLLRVLAAVEPGGYVFGMPHEGWVKEAISFHAPAFGDVGLDLSYATHNAVFEPLRFPLVKGETWQTVYANVDLIATVEGADETTATIRFDAVPSEPGPLDPVTALLGGGGSVPVIRLVYDASQHEIVKFEAGGGSWEVFEHGYGFEDWVTVPRGEHTVIDYFRSLQSTEPNVAAQTIELTGGYNRLTLMHVLSASDPGLYRIRAGAPDGSEFVTEATGPSESNLVRYYEARDPDGEWTLEDVVAGPGFTYSMGIAYHQYDIRVADGAIRTDHSHDVTR